MGNDANPLDTLDIDERPPPIVKLADVQPRAQLLATTFYGQPIIITLAYMMKLQAISK